MREGWANLLLGAIIGLLIGLAICYGKQALGLYKKKDVITSGLDFANALGIKL